MLPLAIPLITFTEIHNKRKTQEAQKILDRYYLVLAPTGNLVASVVKKKRD